MEVLEHSLAGLANFALYFLVSLIALLLFKVIYTWITPHDEWALVKEKNTAAAVGLSGAILGFSIALSGAASNSVNLIDFSVWAVVALIAQLIAFLIVRLRLPKIIQRIKDDELPAAIVLAGISIAIGLLNAACMSY